MPVFEFALASASASITRATAVAPRRARVPAGSPAFVGMIVALLLGAGCVGGDPLARSDVDLAPGPEWTALDPTDPATRDRLKTPGRLLAAYEGPNGASLTVHAELPIPAPDPSALAFEIATRWTNLPELEVISRGVWTWPGGDRLDAARVEAVASGTGDRWLPTGRGEPVAPAGETRAVVPTRRLLVATPRESDTIVFTFHAPDAARDAALAAFEEILGSARVGRGPALGSQSYAAAP